MVMSDYIKPTQRIERFMLEDKTGSVLIDATSCRVRAGWISEVAAIFGVREIVLTRRIERDDFTDAVRKRLEYGDRIYVIGNAERDNSGSLVIRPASRPGWNEVIWKTLFGAVKPPKGKDIHGFFKCIFRVKSGAVVLLPPDFYNFFLSIPSRNTLLQSLRLSLQGETQTGADRPGLY